MSDINSNFIPNPNQSNSSTHHGTPNKKKRNELHDASDARFQSPHHISSIISGTNTANLTALGSPEINNFMSVFMSPMTAQYHPNVPDSKDWTPGIQHKLANEGFLTFPDAVTPGAMTRTSLSNLRPGASTSLSTSSILGSGLGSAGAGSSSLLLGHHHGHGSATDPSFQSPLFPDLLDSSSSGSGLNPDLMLFPHPAGSLLPSNSSSAGSSIGGELLMDNHFAQNSQALKNRLNKRKNASSESLTGLHLSSLEQQSEGSSLFTQATGLQAISTVHNVKSPRRISKANNNSKASSQPISMIGIADVAQEHSQMSTSSDISGIAAITAAAFSLPPSQTHMALSNESSPDGPATVGLSSASKNKSKTQSAGRAKDKQQQRAIMQMEVDDRGDTKRIQSDDRDEEDNEDEVSQHQQQQLQWMATGMARSFMSPEMRELTMRTTPQSVSASGGRGFNNPNPNNSSGNNAGHNVMVNALGLVVCNCKKSKCLKMYCDCFRLSEYCKQGCNCVECCNIEKFDAMRLAARKSIQDRNPEAFKPRVQEAKNEHLTGCHCRKSACLKKYCECYTGKVPCSNRCRCVDCQNLPTLYMKQPPVTTAAAHIQQIQQQQQQPHSSTDRTSEGKYVASSAFGNTSGNHLAHSSTTVHSLPSTTSLSINNIMHVASNSSSMGFDKDNTTSPSAAVAVLQTLSAGKAPQPSLLQLRSSAAESSLEHQPVQLFPDGAEEEEDGETDTARSGTHNQLSIHNEALRIDIPRQSSGSGGKLPDSGAMSSVPTSALASALMSSYQHAQNAGMITNPNTNSHQTHINNGSLYSSFSAPQSPVRTLSQNNNNNHNSGVNSNLNYSLSAVASPPKLLELAEWCEERQTSREIVFPLPSSLAAEFEAGAEKNEFEHR
jgi:hypothetical protein